MCVPSAWPLENICLLQVSDKCMQHQPLVAVLFAMECDLRGVSVARARESYYGEHLLRGERAALQLHSFEKTTWKGFLLLEVRVGRRYQLLKNLVSE